MSLVNCKMVVVGDGAVGKTSLLITYTSNQFPRDYVPTVFDNYSANVRVKDEVISLAFWDTAGQEDYDRLRPLSYPCTDVFLVTFSVAAPTSFANVKSKWVPEIKHHCPQALVVLCGLKIDLRSDAATRDKLQQKGQSFVTEEQGRQLAKEIGAMQYYEVSSLTNVGIAAAFDGILRDWSVDRLEGRRSSARSGGFSFGSLFSRSKSSSSASIVKASNELAPPSLPEKRWAAPFIYPLTETFDTDMAKLVAQSQFSDVDLFVEGQTISAHRVLLCMGSTLWRRVFGCAATTSDNVSADDINNKGALLPAIAAIAERRGADGRARFAVALGPTVTYASAMAMLSFVYSGCVPELSVALAVEERRQTQHHRGSPAVTKFDKGHLAAAHLAADLFDLSDLTSWCTNCESGDTVLNPSLTTWHNECCGVWAKQNIVNKKLFADVVFVIDSDGTRVFAHRAVMHVRSSVMARLFEGRFADGRAGAAHGIVCSHVGGVESRTFIDMLEYLYTQHAPIDEHDAVDLMQLADRYNVPCLATRCELAISKAVDSAVAGRIQRADVDLIGLLMFAEQTRGAQLGEFLKHFIATNYGPMKRREEWAQLEAIPEALKFIEEHKWPPQSYLDQLAEYERKVAAQQSKSLLGRFTSSLFSLGPAAEAVEQN
jgi:small GTP-binding protein